jgi:hypothetical protein
MLAFRSRLQVREESYTKCQESAKPKRERDGDLHSSVLVAADDAVLVVIVVEN